MEKDNTLFGELAFDEEKKQMVVILNIWDNKFADGIFTYADVVGKNDCKKYSTDFRNLTYIEK